MLNQQVFYVGPKDTERALLELVSESPAQTGSIEEVKIAVVIEVVLRIINHKNKNDE